MLEMVNTFEYFSLPFGQLYTFAPCGHLCKVQYVQLFLLT